MPREFRFSPPMLRNDYTQLTKTCCVEFQSEKEYIGACIKAFRDYAERHDERRNFKFTIKDENGYKLFTVRVSGGFAGMTRTKYYVDNGGIYRYDWRSNFWDMMEKLFIVIRKALPFVSGAQHMISWFNN